MSPTELQQAIAAARRGVGVVSVAAPDPDAPAAKRRKQVRESKRRTRVNRRHPELAGLGRSAYTVAFRAKVRREEREKRERLRLLCSELASIPYGEQRARKRALHYRAVRLEAALKGGRRG